MQQNYVFVIDINKQQLNPVTPKKTYRLLELTKAAVFRIYPFILILKKAKVGEYIGKIAIRSTGSFNILTREKLVQGISYKYCKTIHFKDGYSYAF